MFKRSAIGQKLTVFLVVLATLSFFAHPVFAVLNSSSFLSKAQEFINNTCTKKHLDNQQSLLCYLFYKTNELDTGLTNAQHTINGLVTSDASQSAEIALLQQEVASLGAKLIPPTTCVQIPSGIISWWPGDGNTNDISGPNNGVLQNGATFAPGEVNQAFSFDGAAASFQSGTVSLPTGNNNRTLDLWVKINSFLADVPDPHSPQESFFAGYGNFGTSGQSYNLGTAGNVLYFSQFGGAIFGPSLQTGKWYHVAVTNTGNSATLYLNGAVVTTGNLDINTAAGSNFYIGKIPDPLGSIRKLNGLVDEVEIFNRALTLGEIKSIFDAGSGGKCK